MRKLNGSLWRGIQRVLLLKAPVESEEEDKFLTELQVQKNETTLHDYVV